MRIVPAVLLAAALSSAGYAQSPPSAEKLVKGFGPEVREGFTRVRAATAGFVSLDSAVAVGYARDVPRCFVDEHHGAMGFHHINRAWVDAKVEVEKPEILLFERHPGGRYVLNGVEYIIPFRVWPKDSTPPTIMGQTLKQEHQLNLWYLHMWIWTDNPSGLFADWNPSVKCP
ncbi:MAG: hypothetical protein ACRENB_07005 [Gemmatimonadales bacterium]